MAKPKPGLPELDFAVMNAAKTIDAILDRAATRRNVDGATARFLLGLGRKIFLYCPEIKEWRKKQAHSKKAEGE